MKFFLAFFFVTSTALAAGNYYLSSEDQKYFKNEPGDGQNSLERIDMNVKEINKLHGEIAGLKAEIQALRKDIDELKKGK